MEKNSHGDVLALKNTSGTVVEDYMYDAFGKQTVSTGNINPFRYCGEYFDAESGLIYLRNRYYDPSMGRFTQMDTHWNPGNSIYGDRKYGENEIKIPDIEAIVQSTNLYVYAMNNPVRYVDPSGESGAAIVGGIVAILIQYGPQLMNIANQIGVKFYELCNILSQIDVNQVVQLIEGGKSAIQNFANNFSNSTPGDPNQKPSLNTVNNSTANEIAQKNGFKDAHEFKESFVGKENVSKFNMKIDKNTGEIFLESVQKGGTMFATGYYK